MDCARFLNDSIDEASANPLAVAVLAAGDLNFGAKGEELFKLDLKELNVSWILMVSYVKLLLINSELVDTTGKLMDQFNSLI